MSAALKHPAPGITDAVARRIDWAMVIDVAEAARRLGLHEGHVRRRCGDEWQDRALAFHTQRPGEPRARWWVDRRADPRLKASAALETSGGRLPEQFYTFTTAQRELAWRRVDCVTRLRELRQTATEPIKRWLPRLLEQLSTEYPQLKGVSRTQLYKWDQLYKTPADVVALVDRRGGDQKSKGDPAAWRYFADIYLDDKRPSLTWAWKQTRSMAEREGWAWCSKKSCERQLDTRIDPEKQLYHREPARWRKQVQPTIEQDPAAYPAGTCWLGDHRQADVWVRLGDSVIRPWLTAWMDRGTRRIVGWVLSAGPNSSTILQALRRGLLDPANKGGPDRVHIDNGKDYDAWIFHGQTKSQRLMQRGVKVEVDEPTFRGIFGLLGVDVGFSLPYNPNGKSPLERLFRYIGENLDIGYVSYAGNSPTNKPESLQRVLARPGQIPTFSQYEQDLGAAVDAINARTDHQIEHLRDEQTGERLSPDQAMAQWCDRVRTPADPAALDMCLQTWHRPVTVGRQGVTINVLGARLRYGAFDSELSPYKAPLGSGRNREKPRVMVSYDADDLSAVWVWTLEGRLICKARANERGGHADRAAVARQMKRKRQYAAALKTVANDRELEYLSMAELIALDEPPAKDPGGAVRPADAASGGPMKLVRTPLDGVGPDAERIRHKQAAGAETADDPRPDARAARGLKSLSELRDLVSPHPRTQETNPAAPYGLAAFRDDPDGSDDEEPYDADLPPLSAFRSGS